MRHVFSSFSPAVYAELNILANLAQENLLEQLSLMTIKPEWILDLGCGVAKGAEQLKKLYETAQVIAIDEIEGMLHYAKAQAKKQYAVLCADGVSLPFPNKSIDLIYANLFLPWCEDWDAALKEIKRVLRPEGLFIFSCLGIDTLKELTQKEIILPCLIDLHVIGDQLTALKFADPVLSVEHIVFSYQSQDKLNAELLQTGMLSSATTESLSSITYEVVYGHAFGPPITADQVADSAGIVKIPIQNIKKTNKNRLL